MSKKPTGAAAGTSEAIRIYERIEEDVSRSCRPKPRRTSPRRSPCASSSFLIRNSAFAVAGRGTYLGQFHPQSGSAITAASSVRAPANTKASGTTVFVIPPSAHSRNGRAGEDRARPRPSSPRKPAQQCPPSSEPTSNGGKRVHWILPRTLKGVRHHEWLSSRPWPAQAWRLPAEGLSATALATRRITCAEGREPMPA